MPLSVNRGVDPVRPAPDTRGHGQTGPPAARKSRAGHIPASAAGDTVPTSRRSKPWRDCGPLPLDRYERWSATAPSRALLPDPGKTGRAGGRLHGLPEPGQGREDATRWHGAPRKER